MQHAVNQQEAALALGRHAESGGLSRDVRRCEHDVAELAGLPFRKVRVVRTLALERDDVRGAISAAPLGVELAHAIVPHD